MNFSARYGFGSRRSRFRRYIYGRELEVSSQRNMICIVSASGEIRGARLWLGNSRFSIRRLKERGYRNERHINDQV